MRTGGGRTFAAPAGDWLYGGNRRYLFLQLRRWSAGRKALAPRTTFSATVRMACDKTEAAVAVGAVTRLVESYGSAACLA